MATSTGVPTAGAGASDDLSLGAVGGPATAIPVTPRLVVVDSMWSPQQLLDALTATAATREAGAALVYDGTAELAEAFNDRMATLIDLPERC